MKAIVVAWAEEAEEWDGKPYARDLGYAPKTKLVKHPKAIMWLNAGTESDVNKAEQYAASNGYTVFTYPTTEKDPLSAARRDILKPKKAGDCPVCVDRFQPRKAKKVAKTLVKLSNNVRNLNDDGTVQSGRSVDGEYPGGLKEARWFSKHTTGGSIAVKRITQEGGLSHVQYVRRDGEVYSEKGSKVAKKKASEKRLCLPAGYAYQLDTGLPARHAGDSWRKAKDDDWEITVTEADPVRILGRRMIDGTECVVCQKTGGSIARKGAGTIFAVTAIAFGKGV